MKNNENGRSMVEMLGVLAIIGVLSAGGLAGYSKAMYKYRVNETMNQLTMIVSNIRTLFGSQSTYDGLTVANSLKYGIITPDMAAEKSGDTVTKIQNPFKGSVYIAPSVGRVGTDNEAFIIEYNGLPAEACVTMITSDWGSAAGSGLIGIAADGDCNGAAGGSCAAAKGTTNSGLKRTEYEEDGETVKSQKTASLDSILIKEANSTSFPISLAVTACKGTGTDTSGNASVALKYY